ncbi:bacteriophage holin [Microbulbifer sp. SAOS-129_SWC]|uniref:bacteriophage holin n=1 Tax=Microbulbifer sp. SAOS-129_SWC TaxID=3145235 RepID=UPI0032166D10
MKSIAPNALGVAIGALWALYVFFCGITALFGWGTTLVEVLGSLYIGYGPTLAGAVIGAVWGFVDGYIAGVVIGWIYNKLSK